MKDGSSKNNNKKEYPAYNWVNTNPSHPYRSSVQ